MTLRYAFRRLLTVVPVALVVLLVSFSLVELMPGDPAQVLAGESATPDKIQKLREQLGLTQGIVHRFDSYVSRVFRGDFGNSLFSGRSVTASIKASLQPTLSLIMVSLVISTVLSLILGTIAALRKGHLVDRLISAGAAIGLGIPPFVFAFLLIVPFALNRSWFPATGYVPIGGGIGPWFRTLVLPAIALAVPCIAELARQVRGALIDTLEQDYFRTARATGLGEIAVIGKHGFKNSAVPIVTVLGSQVARLLGGVIVVEYVFGIPGFGALTYNSVLAQDLPLIRAIVIVSALMVLAVNLLVDLSYVYFNPKLR